jgi:hypothetical protein
LILVSVGDTLGDCHAARRSSEGGVSAPEGEPDTLDDVPRVSNSRLEALHRLSKGVPLPTQSCQLASIRIRKYHSCQRHHKRSHGDECHDAFQGDVYRSRGKPHRAMRLTGPPTSPCHNPSVPYRIASDANASPMASVVIAAATQAGDADSGCGGTATRRLISLSGTRVAFAEGVLVGARGTETAVDRAFVALFRPAASDLSAEPDAGPRLSASVM